MMNAAHAGKIKAMYIMAENPLVTDPDLHHVEAALRNLDFLVVQDIFPTETTALADVILPGAAWAEKDGTFSNTERRVQLVRKAVEPPGEARADWEIITDLARRLLPAAGRRARTAWPSWRFDSPAADHGGGRRRHAAVRRHSPRAAREGRHPVAMPNAGPPGHQDPAPRQVQPGPGQVQRRGLHRPRPRSPTPSTR